MNRKKITEARDVNIYKSLLCILGDYVKSFPCTGVDGLFDTLLEQGKKVLPKDNRALDILEYIVVTTGTGPDVVQKLLNIRFADLPTQLKPVFKNSKKHEIASWENNGKISDRTKDLINWSGKSGQGRWVDIDGSKVTLINK